jgi:hypothetical protein
MICGPAIMTKASGRVFRMSDRGASLLAAAGSGRPYDPLTRARTLGRGD